MENRNEDLKNIGDAGDSFVSHRSPNTEKNENKMSPVCELMYEITETLQRGNCQGVHMLLTKLNALKQSNGKEARHNYWRVAQYVGETDLYNLILLVSVASEVDSTGNWDSIEDALTLLATCLCNREIVYRLLHHNHTLLPVLVSAVVNNAGEVILVQALKIMSVAVTVCRARFARDLISCNFFDSLLSYWKRNGPPHSSEVLDMALQVIKSFLMCGQSYILTYSKRVLERLADVVEAMGPKQEDHAEWERLVGLYQDLVRSTEGDKKAHMCAKFWTKERLRKELLRECLGQPWLFIYCSWPFCGRHNARQDIFLRKCSACGLVRYCSRQCQQKHWVSGHKTACSIISGQNK